MDQEHVNFTWDSSEHFRKVLQEMIISDDFTDVTLVTDDMRQIKAHRNILSACSPVLKNIFQIDSHGIHPLIYLRGIHFTEMEKLIQWIYFGETAVNKEKINDFLSLTQYLQVNEFLQPLNMLNEHKVDLLNSIVTIDNFTDLKQPDTAETTTFVTAKAPRKFPCNECSYRATQQASLNRHIESKHENRKLSCPQCEYQAGRHDTLVKHIQSRHEGVKYPCKLCDYQATQKSSLKMHNQSAHDGVNYFCTNCGLKFSTKSNLKAHYKKINACIGKTV